MFFKDNKKTIIHAVIVGFFTACAILTVAVGKDVDDDISGGDDKQPVEAITDSQVNQSEATPEADSVTVSPPIETDPYEELHSLIGLESVKDEVGTLSNFVKIQKQREEQGLKNTSLSYHLVFTGNPGTGKTTVARIVARIFKDLGVLKKGHLVETDRSGLIAEYVGQTAVKTNAVIDSAMNGVLFIDEAYALTEGKSGGSDYGSEAIATLLKRMEDNRDSLIVIVAGYTDEIKRFIDSNPGLQSRFTRYIDFPDYSADELYKIYLMRSDKYKYHLTDEAAKYLKSHLEYQVAHKDRNFGNGRYVRNVFEKTLTSQANRLAVNRTNSKEMLSIIEKEDIENAIK